MMRVESSPPALRGGDFEEEEKMQFAALSLLIAASSAQPDPKWCTASPQSAWPVCDPLRSLDDRAADVVSRISLADKIQLLSGGQYPGGGSNVLAKGIPAPSIGLGPCVCKPPPPPPHTHARTPPARTRACVSCLPPRLPPPPPLRSCNPLFPLRRYNWWSEATHGLLFVEYSEDLPGATNTALPITTSCSFNRTLWRETGNRIGREARSFYNARQAYSTFW
jgi:hypothetical protein